MASETLHFDNARLAQALYCNEPKNLRLIEDLLGIRVSAREDWINVEGDREAGRAGRSEGFDRFLRVFLVGPVPDRYGPPRSSERDRALLFRTLATLRTDIPLFDDVDQLRWNGPTAASAAFGARFDAAVTENKRSRRPSGQPESRDRLDQPGAG